MTRTKVLNTILFVFLILFSNINSIRISSKTSTAQDLLAKGGYANMCIKAMTDSMPPGFCWKKGADAGVIPTGCPPGFFRSLALCYQYCAPGYTHILGICYKDCDAGYDNHGLSCYKNIIRWYFKHAYIPESLTNFSDKVPCPGDMYRAGALCYRDCRIIGMENCGIGACIAEGASCSMQILQMVGQVLEGVGTGVTTVLSLGSSIPAKTSAKVAVKAAVKKLAKDAVSAAVKAAKSALTGKFKKIVLKNAAKKAKDTLKDMLKDKFKETLITSICGKVWESLATKTITAPSVEDLGSKIVDTIDVLGVGNVAKSCSDTGADGGLGCGKAIVESLAAFDPSGLLTIAAAFMHPSCDVPVYKPKEEPIADLEADTSAQSKSIETDAMKSLKEATVVPKNCLWVYDQTNFKGNKLEICSSLAFFEHTFNNKIYSFVTGAEMEGYFFSDNNFEGNFLTFTKGLSIDDTAKFTFGSVNLKDEISSVWIGNPAFLIVYSKTSVMNFFLNKEMGFKVTFGRANRSNVDKFGIFNPTGKKIECSFIEGTSRETLTFEKNDIINSSSWPKNFLEGCKLI